MLSSAHLSCLYNRRAPLRINRFSFHPSKASLRAQLQNCGFNRQLTVLKSTKLRKISPSSRFISETYSRLNLKTLFKFIPARFAKTPQYVDVTVADHYLYFFGTLVGLAIRLRYHLHDIDCHFDDGPR